MEELVPNEKIPLEKQKELYVATLAHDLKNPLNAQIIALEQFYKEKFGGITNLQKEILNDIISSSKFMHEMLSSLLSVYKLDNGVVKLHKTKVNLDQLIKICLKDISLMADEHCIFIQYQNNSISNTLFCDENYIRRVITNMLNNIVLYSYKNTKPLISVNEDTISFIIRFKKLLHIKNLSKLDYLFLNGHILAEMRNFDGTSVICNRN